MKLVLASKSPNRKKILEKYGYDFEVDVSSVDESVIKNDDVKELVLALAKLKAETVARRHEDAVIIGADTLVYFEGEQIGQAKDYEEAEKIMRKLIGKTHEVCSGVCVINTANNKMLQVLEISKVTLNDVSDETLKEYIASGQYKGKAGAYNIDDPEFESFVRNIEGCHYNIKGMPIEKIKQMIKEVQE